MTSFNDGIEAAAKYLRDRRDENKEVGNEFQALMCEAQAQAVEALKRPEPSEVERMPWPVINTLEAAGADIPPKADPSDDECVEKVAAAIERELMVGEMLLADPVTLLKLKAQRIARAALRAMEKADG